LQYPKSSENGRRPIPAAFSRAVLYSRVFLVVERR
jgi:hypothetical protein